VSAFADPRCSGIIALDQQAETMMVDLEVPVEGVALDALDAFLSSALPPLQQKLAVQRDLLTTLIGRLPSQEPSEKFELASLQLPQELPVSLPSNLVEQRPDIQSAEAQLHSASASIGVAVAARLPQFTLTANAGTTANEISQLFMTPGTAFWTVAGNVAQTVFDAGTLLHKERAAEAAFDQAAAMYRSTVIAAFQNVADSLHALQSDAETLKATYAAERAAFKSLEIARRQLQLGAVGYLGLLTAENTYNTALLALVQAQAARYADTAALFQALGGAGGTARTSPRLRHRTCSSSHDLLQPNFGSLSVCACYCGDVTRLF